MERKLKIAGFDSSSINPIIWEWCHSFNIMGHEADNYNIAYQSLLSCFDKNYDIVILVGPLELSVLRAFKENTPHCKVIYFKDCWEPFLSNYGGILDFVMTLQSENPQFKVQCESAGLRFEYFPLCGNENLFFPMECEKEFDVGFVGGLSHGNRGEEKYLYPILDNSKYTCFLGGMMYKGFGHPSVPYERVNSYRNKMRVSLNFHTAYQKAPGIRQDLNQSVYNIALSGVLQICDHPLAKELFQGSIVVPDEKDWLDAVDYYVNHEAEGKILAQKSREIALTHHSMRARLNHLIKLCFPA